jgi:hypothetical protein
MESFGALFVTVTVYVLVPDCPVRRFQDAGETVFSIVHSNVLSQCASAVLNALIGDVALAVGAMTPTAMAAHARSHSFRLKDPFILAPFAFDAACATRAVRGVRPPPRRAPLSRRPLLIE